MALTIEARGSTTITATAPGTYVAQTVTVSGLQSTDTVIITPQGTGNIDALGANGLYVASVSSGSFVVASVRPQLLANTTINICVITGTA